ncbi:toxin-antitoxin system YwqK family antitoxin [Hymenobacter jejuensis]|uniref:Toxin-antitoxin system YwqK family antitoxin n=1 Tax=Hymenobacter jejuensis TaxID=2502781 RepID=A0A5B7ZXF3_9BACT|nr:hypothetical protein [Hymenobacter jejuensis]QDA59814.1 hypothetical protein FHG12_06700 [Hymenobacter jejuensis]
MCSFRLPFFLLAFVAVWLGSCSKKTVSFNSKPDQFGIAALSNDSLTSNRDTTGLVAKRTNVTKEQARIAQAKEKSAQRKPKRKKNIFLGERIKKGYVKSGGKGRNQVVEVFYYLRTFQQPNPYAPARYYFNPRKRRISPATTELNPATDKVLHGPYTKRQGGKVVEKGFYAFGTKHLRWEKYTPDNILLSKTHYEMGFPRDANITYYDTEHKHIKEVVPYINGKLEGDYARYLENGELDWKGQFENGKRVGEWTKYWGFRTRNRPHYVYQYGESGYDPEVLEPELIEEYSRDFKPVYQKGKLDKRPSTADQPAGK